MFLHKYTYLIRDDVTLDLNKSVSHHHFTLFYTKKPIQYYRMKLKKHFFGANRLKSDKKSHNDARELNSGGATRRASTDQSAEGERPAQSFSRERHVLRRREGERATNRESARAPIGRRSACRDQQEAPFGARAGKVGGASPDVGGEAALRKSYTLVRFSKFPHSC